MNTFSLFAYTFSHFAVDYVCLLTILDPFGSKAQLLGGTQSYALFVILYNFLAFGLQMAVGYFSDYHKRVPIGAIGCVSVLIGAVCSANSQSALTLWTAVLFVGVGNACFHVGGGIDSLVNSNGKLSRGGVFVSSGAMGVALGIYSCGRISSGDVAVIVLMVFCAAICFAAHKNVGVDKICSIKGVANGKLGIQSVLALALISVTIRSFGGSVIPMEWKTTAELGLLSSFGAFCGKFIGGFAADKFGAKRIGTTTLLLSLLFIIFGSKIMTISLIGVVLFNMTMPITLGICAEKLPKNPGLAFGLTTAALLIGAVPSFFAVVSGKTILLVPAVIVSAVCIFISGENKKSEVAK